MKRILAIIVIVLLAALIPLLGGSLLKYAGGNPRLGTRLGDSLVAFALAD